MIRLQQTRLLELTLVCATLALGGCGKDKKKTDSMAFGNPPPAAPTAPTGVAGGVPQQPMSMLGDSFRDVRLQVDPYRSEFRLALTFEDWESGSCIYVGALQGPMSLQTTTTLNYVPNRQINTPFYSRWSNGNGSPIANDGLQQEVGSQFSGTLRCLTPGCTNAEIQLTRVSRSGESHALLVYQKYYHLQYQTQFYNYNRNGNQYNPNYGSPQNYPHQYYQWLNWANDSRMNLAVIDVVGSGKQFFQIESDYYTSYVPQYQSGSPWYRSASLGREARSSGKNRPRNLADREDRRSVEISGSVGNNASLFFRPEFSQGSGGKYETSLIKNQEANVTWDKGSLTLRIEFMERNKKRVVVEASAIQDPKNKFDAEFVPSNWKN